MGLSKLKPKGQYSPPEHLQSAGRALWSSTLTEWELESADLVVLATACECADRLVQIRAALDTDGIILTDPSGRKRSHPLMAAESQTQNTLLRAWNQLGLDDSEPPKIGRPATRV
jgi:P27 family predicted phage terminase small subunit